MAQNALEVRLEVPWPTHKLWPLLETSEALDDQAAFWAFVDEACSREWTGSELSTTLSEAVDLGSKLAHQDAGFSHDLLRLALELREFAPAIEQQRQLGLALRALTRADADFPDDGRAWVALTLSGSGEATVVDQVDKLGPALEALLADLKDPDARERCRAAASESEDQPSPLDTFDDDHVHPHSALARDAGSVAVAVLHGVLGRADFAAAHDVLSKAVAASTDLVYVARYMPGADADQDPLAVNKTVLQGFGVALDIKNMEYLTVDDDSGSGGESGGGKPEAQDAAIDLTIPVAGVTFEKLVQRFPDAKTSLVELRADLESEELEAASKSGELAQIKVWDMMNLGLQTTIKILADSDPLVRWEDLAQNFPSRARSLINVRVPGGLMEQVERVERSIEVPDGTVLVNGVSVDAKSESFNIFSLMEAIRGENKAREAAEALVRGGGKLLEPIATRMSVAASPAGGGNQANDPDALIRASGTRLDIRADAKGAILFLNNIETDAAYARWPSRLDALMQQSYQLASIRKNLFTVILFIDPSTALGHSMMQTAYLVLQQHVPIRIGLVFVTGRATSADEDELEGQGGGLDACGARCYLALFLAGAKINGREATVRAMGALVRAHESLLTESDAVEVFANAQASLPSAKQRLSAAAFAALAREYLGASHEETTTGFARMKDFTRKKGISAPTWTLNGLVFPGAGDFQTQLVQEAFKEQRVLMYQVHFRRLTASTNVLKFLLENGQAIPRYNEVVMQETAESEFSPVPSSLAGEDARVHYLLDSASADVTLFLALDEASLHTSRGRSLLRALVGFIETKPTKVRAAVLPLGIGAGDSASLLATLMHALRDDDLDTVETLMSDDEGMEAPSLKAPASWMHELSAQLGSWKGLRPQSVVANGRIIDASSSQVSMAAEDLELVVSHERATRADFVRVLLGKKRASPDVIMQFSPLAASQATSPRQRLPMDHMRKHFPSLCYSSTGPGDAPASDQEKSALSVQAVIDPLSEAAPRVAGVVRLLRDRLRAHVDLVFTPKASVSTFPLSSYFRFLAANNEPDPAHGGIYPADEAPAARFYGVPQEQLLTLKVFTPEAWIVYPTYTAGLDTDNIRLSRAPAKRSTVSFVLSKLLVTGHCVDTSAGTPPAGLQLQLQPVQPQAVVSSDTLVMQNLGYMQLQAGPGMWELGLADGPSREIYTLRRGLGSRGESTLISVRSFTSAPLSLEAVRRPGRESASLLESMERMDASGGFSSTGTLAAAAAPTSVFAWLTEKIHSFLGMAPSAKTALAQPRSEAPASSSPGGAAASGDNETIHVFSLASGALYERFLRIMMVSVTKATKNPVKFWLIENFLSPDFKAGLGALKREYGFDVALVTYKWPHWLRRQTEKQRIIWGYKILFLDVLFPLDVPKVIYVDADQVVRADLKELWDMDLEGKPYGYTPFCTSRKETLGFQFWRSGYWKDHLRGQPYHISALYVVDLKRFRHMMVGDRLRATYDQLSRDPNSLSNLDQDLPNYAQHMVPIFSLPQEWLWCESWCSDASKRDAKTIDLCNNPLHKEPKLDMAKRVISGDLFPQSWVELDAEIKGVLAA